MKKKKENRKENKYLEIARDILMVSIGLMSIGMNVMQIHNTMESIQKTLKK